MLKTREKIITLLQHGMTRMLKKLISNFINTSDKEQKKEAEKYFNYSEAKEILKNSQLSEKEHLANHPDTEPEILYYLSSDKDPKIRAAIAANPNTPVLADQILAEDKNSEVREELARKISRIFPDINENGAHQICDKAIEVLDGLAEDQFVNVRRIIAEELKENQLIPKNIALKLAFDSDLLVCGPMLEYSPLLSQADLREIIAATTLSGALSAIARRDIIDENTSQVLASSQDIPAIAALLTNENAQIREDTLDLIIEQAEYSKPLHTPLTMRPNLSIRALKRIAGFVASSLVTQMIDKCNLDKDLADDLLIIVRKKIQTTPFDKAADATVAQQAEDLYLKGVLDDDFIQNAVNNCQRELIMHCLAQLSKIPVISVRKIMSSKKAIRICAVTWRADLSMRTAIELQKHIAVIPSDDILNAKDGLDFPVSKPEMDYELAFYDGT